MNPLITIIRETRLDPAFPLSRHELTELVEILLESLGLEDHALEIQLVDDREIARLNKEFMGCTGPTNVLSFPAEHEGVAEDDDVSSLGELALSVDAISRESALYGQPPVTHLARLLAHGILHLAGHDHGEVMYDLTDMAVERVELEYLTDSDEVEYASA